MNTLTALTDEQIADQWENSDVQPQILSKADAFYEGVRFAERWHAALAFARSEPRLKRGEVRALALQAGWVDTPTVRNAYAGFRLNEFAESVYAAARGLNPPPVTPLGARRLLHDVVAQILDAGHMNTEDLARLRAAWEAT